MNPSRRDSSKSMINPRDDDSDVESSAMNRVAQVATQEAEANDENVSVVVRCRPLMGQAEQASCLAANNKNLVQVDELNRCIQVGEREFFFDQVFGPQSDNEQVYMQSARRLVESSFNGFNCTIFLYGQTGTGKTYTHSSITSSSFGHLFSLISASNTRDRFLIRASYYELYNENFRDLLSSESGKSLELRESKSRGVYVKDLTCFLVNNPGELEKLKRIGDKRRATAATKMNEHSSRSHSIFSITIETILADATESGGHQGSSLDSQTTTTSGPPRPGSRPASRSQKNIKSANKQPRPAQQRKPPIRLGRLNLIDLAGSERQTKSGTQGLQLKEASRINLSLTCLSLVIRALTDKSCQHVPYRSSKLTRLLSSSLGGNSKTLLVGCISPAAMNLDETLSTLRFASRTKLIKNRARINEDPKDALLRNYRQQIDELRQKLKLMQAQKSSQAGLKAVELNDDDMLLDAYDNEQQQQQLAQNRGPSDNDNDQDREDEQQLLQQLKLLREKIMIGGENLLEKAEMHERLLEASRRELEQKRREELRLKEQLAKKRDIIEQVVQSKGTMESQREHLDAKLRQVLRLFRLSRDELRDLASEHEQLKGNLLQTIRATSKEIKYADCIIDDFIPRHFLDLINTHARYDDESDEWQIKYIALSGNNMTQTRRLIEGRNTSAATTTSSIEPDEGPESEPGDANGKKRVNKINKRTINIRPDPFLRLAS